MSGIFSIFCFCLFSIDAYISAETNGNGHLEVACSEHSDPDDEGCTSPGRAYSHDVDSTVMLQFHSRTRVLPRVSIRDRKYFAGEQEVVLLGGNYVIKGQPYFPPIDVVRKNAKSMARGASKMEYKPSGGRKVVPVVRLGAMMEGAMPNGPEFDDTWWEKLDAVVNAFAEAGVYVFLDIHQDAWSTTNGGEGIPWWIPAKMQETSGKSYIASPEHPLRSSLPVQIIQVLEKFGIPVPSVKIVDPIDPWLNFSVGHDAGNPAFMNVGNRNMRANNDEEAWSKGVLFFTSQVGNIATRFYKAPFSESGWSWKHHNDRKNIFEPYIKFLRRLCEVWKANSNVVGVELLNEPPVSGQPHIQEMMVARRDLFDWYAAVLEELKDVDTPLAFEDMLGTVENSSPLQMALELIPISSSAKWTLSQRAQKGQLILSYHYYYGVQSLMDFSQQVQLADAEAEEFGTPSWLSEYWTETTLDSAIKLGQAAESGCGAVTYWHYVDKNYTGNPGWYKYSKEVQDAGGPTHAWDQYLASVRNGTQWGALITGAAGGHSDVLEMVPPLEELFPKTTDESKGNVPWSRRPLISHQFG